MWSWEIKSKYSLTAGIMVIGGLWVSKCIWCNMYNDEVRRTWWSDDLKIGKLLWVMNMLEIGR